MHPVNTPDRSFTKWEINLIGPLTAPVEGNSYMQIIHPNLKVSIVHFI